MKWVIGFVGLFIQASLFAQGIEVEYDKSYDFSRHKTFHIDKGEVLIPKKEQRVEEEVVHKSMVQTIKSVLTSKGLVWTDSAADLAVSYVVGARNQAERVDLGDQILGGVQGNTPSSPDRQSRTWSREYQEGFIFIDLVDKNKVLRWRIQATSTEGSIEEEHVIQEVARAGFKKFTLKPKKK